MAGTLNQVTIIGYVGDMPQTHATQDGDTVANVSVATSNRYKNRAGETVDEPEWHRVVFFGKLAETASAYMRKGGLVCIVGRIKTSKYTDKDGVERSATEIVGEKLVLLGSKGGNDGVE